MRGLQSLLSLKIVSMLLPLALILGACHSKRSVTRPATSTNRYERVTDDWATLNITLHSDDNQKLYREIKGWLGVPYRYGGNTKSGVDCSGFVLQVYKTVYNKRVERNSAKIFEKNCRLIDVDELREGDLLFYCTGKKTKGITHVGIYLRDNKFAHASSKGVKISDITEDYFIDHFYAAGRVVK